MQLKGLVFVSLLPSPTSVYRAPWFSASPEFSGRRYSFLGISSAVEVHCGPWHGISQSSLIDLRSFHCLFPPNFCFPLGSPPHLPSLQFVDGTGRVNHHQQLFRSFESPR
ncbi:hypothetical protein SLA2020_242470 [Shorea laevis]